MVNPSTELALDISKSMLSCGVTDVVVCPGSRSAPLAWQMAQLASQGKLNLHTRIDEREAGFLALGIAKATKRPVPVVVTSGTAVANLLPAVVEAHHSGIPLVVLSADRPAAVRGNSAPQTTNQVGMFNSFVKAQVDTAVPTSEILDAIKSSLISHPGPVHINAQFDMPLMPDDPEIEFGEVNQIQITEEPQQKLNLELPSKGLLVIGDLPEGTHVQELIDLAQDCGYPIIWEPTAQVLRSENTINHGALLLQSGKLPKPEVVISAGLIGLSRPVLNVLKEAPQHFAIHLPATGAQLPNPVLSAKQILSTVPVVSTSVDNTWLATWQQASLVASKAITKKLNLETLTGPSAAITLWNYVPAKSSLFISSSWSARHIESYASARADISTFGNRGVNGIDGLISTAIGVALTQPNRTYLLIGDIAYLHGVGGLNISAENKNPNLTVVVLDNDGSGIFSQLEQGAAKYQKHFERIFGTPHGKDLWVIAESLGVPATRVTTKSELVKALRLSDQIPGMHVVVCSTGSRENEQELIAQISAEVISSI